MALYHYIRGNIRALPPLKLSGSARKYNNFYKRHDLLTHNVESNTIVSGFGGLEDACWPLVPKFAGSNPAEAVG
jgi:hypothetical protein